MAALVPALLLILYFGVLSSLLNRWDGLVAITLIPLWAWAGFGMIVSLLAWLLFRGIPSIVVFCLWLATGIVGSEETHTLVRELANTIDPRKAPAEDRRYRVVNVNAFRTVDGLQQVKELKPDMVLVQQPPGESELRTLAKNWFESNFDLLTNGDLAILARGEFLSVIAERDSPAIHARVQIEEGLLIDATSIELAPCLPSPALLNPSTWRTLTDTRVHNRRTLRTQLGENQITQSNIGRIVAGGFQTPPGDDVFRPLESNGMTDAFGATGEGWGNTYPSDYAILRLDQVWVSENLGIHSAKAIPNRASDHRIVIADLVLPGEK